jgi:hypothetical protein
VHADYVASSRAILHFKARDMIMRSGCLLELGETAFNDALLALDDVVSLHLFAIQIINYVRNYLPMTAVAPTHIVAFERQISLYDPPQMHALIC